MTLEEIKEIAETWFEWNSDRRDYITYTSAMLFARDMYDRGQQDEREKYAGLIAAAESVIEEYYQYGGQLSDTMDNLCELLERIKEKTNDATN